MNYLYPVIIDIQIGKNTRILDYHLYFSSDVQHKGLDVESIVKQRWTEICQKLAQHFKTYIIPLVKGYPVKEIKVKERKYGYILTDSGAISEKKAFIFEI